MLNITTDNDTGDDSNIARTKDKEFGIDFDANTNNEGHWQRYNNEENLDKIAFPNRGLVNSRQQV